MTFAALRDRLSVPVEWIANQVAARPKGALVVWLMSLGFVALVF